MHVSEEKPVHLCPAFEVKSWEDPRRKIRAHPHRHRRWALAENQIELPGGSQHNG